MKRVTLLCVLAVATASVALAQAEAPRPELMSRITNAYPVYSPDGEQIAYMCNADGDFDIYVMHLNRQVVNKLTDAPDRDGTPAWSPDGSRIAFQSFRDGRSQVYLMNADGTHQVNISNSAGNDEHPFWSADGRKILFCSDRTRTNQKGDDNIDIFEMDAGGGDVRRITSTREVETYASWSADGSKIVCRQILANDDWEVVVMNSDGSNPINISNHEGVDGWPVWSPDGSRIAYASQDGLHTRIFVVDADGTNRARVSDDAPFDDRQPAWHPDGSRLLFARYQWFAGSWYEASEIYAVKIGN